MEPEPKFFDIDSLEASKIQLESRADALRQDIARMKVELEAVEERLTLTARLVHLERGGDGPVSKSPVHGPKQDLLFVVSQPEDYIELEVESILEANEEPLHISEIREQLVARGVQIPGRGDDANIIVRLRKDDGRFVRTARGTYGLPKWGIPSIDKPKTRKGRSSR